MSFGSPLAKELIFLKQLASLRSQFEPNEYARSVIIPIVEYMPRYIY